MFFISNNLEEITLTKKFKKDKKDKCIEKAYQIFKD